ncbi:hypothetical protein E3N88_43040 [Mikania micrantha]|uniref:Uncharacterized protein n=1 Tax=Mikania micrantha TaxID=192012 RepID=A0A5N6LI91_9ASTR|nr:hypothetical protein E3N88_43040 [Mikania micrantha]
MSLWDGSFFNYYVPDLNEEPPVEYSYGTIDLNAEPNADVGFGSQASYHQQNDYGFVYDDSNKSNPEEDYEEKTADSNINWETKEVINDNHNHEPAQNLEGHPYVRRFTQEEEDMVENLTKQHMDPHRDLAVMSACRKLFLEAAKYLCRWHIDENIAKHCKASFSEADWKKFKGRCANLCSSPTTELYDYNYSRLYERLIKDNKKRVLEYLTRTHG